MKIKLSANDKLAAIQNYLAKADELLKDLQANQHYDHSRITKARESITSAIFEIADCSPEL